MNQYISLESSHFHGGSFSFSLILSHRVTANRLYRGCMFLQYYWEILQMLIFDDRGDNIVTEALMRMQWLSLNSNLGQSTLITHDCQLEKAIFTLHGRLASVKVFTSLQMINNVFYLLRSIHFTANLDLNRQSTFVVLLQL